MTDLGCITAELELSAIKYQDGIDIEEHISNLRTGWAKANGQGAMLTDAESLPNSWLFAPLIPRQPHSARLTSVINT